MVSEARKAGREGRGAARARAPNFHKGVNAPATLVRDFFLRVHKI